MKPTLQEQIEYGMIGMKSAKKHKVVTPEQDSASKASRHAESTLHLTFCKWVRATYPTLQFVRHEREKQRSYQSQNMMQVYNSVDMKLPDFELLAFSGRPYESGFRYLGLYIEFKKPGRAIRLQNGKLAADLHEQYNCHLHLWNIGRCAYFCNDLEDAKVILINYLAGTSLPEQIFTV